MQNMDQQPARYIAALDMDDTLLNSAGELSPRTRDALRRWRAAGHHAVIATGRPPRSIGDSLPEELHDVPWIAYNGAVIHWRGRQVYENLISVDETQAILALVQARLPTCALGVEIDNQLYFNQTINRTSPYQVADLMEIATQPSAKILFFHEDFEALHGMLADLPPGARALLSAKYKLVQILAASADKAEALRVLAEQLGHTLADVVAFGDDVNDVDMVRISGIGVAVDNAVGEVKAVADRVTRSNDEDGVALVLEELLAQAYSPAASPPKTSPA